MLDHTQPFADPGEFVRACRVWRALYAGSSAHVSEKLVHGFDAMLCASGREPVVLPL